MPIPAQPENAHGETLDHSSAATPAASAVSGGVLGEHELEATLQLLTERAQFITGATGAALALVHGDQMVCHASAGASAPAVGVHLQVLSGLTGESISRKQLLRCDDAETDSRVNRETCQALGIASIVVLPLLSRNGEVQGLFELFSDHAYAFEERDLRALERMAELTRTALDLAETHQPPIQTPVPAGESPGSPSQRQETLHEEMPLIRAVPETPAENPGLMESPPGASLKSAVADRESTDVKELSVSSAAVPDAMQRVRKCTSCGFPVSEGRSLCLDCEKKQGRASYAGESEIEEPVPEFLASVPPKPESWWANHVNVLAIIVLLLSILVAIVVFRP